MGLKKFGLFFVICFICHLISLVSATDLQLSKKISNTGTITGNMPTVVPGNIMKPNVIIRDFQAKAEVSNKEMIMYPGEGSPEQAADFRNYDLMYSYSYVVENRGYEIVPVETGVYTPDSNDLEYREISKDTPTVGEMNWVLSGDSEILDIPPGGYYSIHGKDYIKKSNRWLSLPGAAVTDDLCAFVKSGGTTYDEKCVKLALP